jgi:hypothetical protein
MRADEDRTEAGAIWQLQASKAGAHGRMGLSAETVYWVSFTIGLAVLVLLIVEILGSLAA